MIKKIAISIGVLFSFFLMFLFGFEKVNVLAYSDIGNALGSYPVKLDIDNYNTDNKLFNFNNYNGTYTNTACGVTARYYPNSFNFIMSGTSTCSNTTIYNFGTFYLDNVEAVTLKMFYVSGSIGIPIGSDIYAKHVRILALGNGNWGNAYTVNEDELFFSSKTLASYDYFNLVLMVNQGASAIGTIYDNYTFKLYYDNNYYDNTQLENLGYSSPFVFGYNVNYSLSVNNLTSTQVNAGISITDSNGNYLKTGNCIIPASSSTICSNLNDPLYLPFNIDNNGYVSFDYSLGLFIGPVGNLSVSSNDSGFNFVPVFNAYYNGSSTNNLYFKDRYTFNNLFLSGFNVSVNSSTLSKVSFPRNQVDSEYSMNTNKIVNFATDKKIETGIYNYINYTDFINSNPSDIYSFVVTAGVSSPVLLQDRIFTISFSNLSLKVIGDSGNSSPLPNNPNTINKYNECSAWYDIPCQLGNGLTYVIYEAPIISPVLTFIVSFITMFSSLVSFVYLFRSFGILFGCFIIYMFINLLHKYSK